jgi:hypothetical protein
MVQTRPPHHRSHVTTMATRIKAAVIATAIN